MGRTGSGQARKIVPLNEPAQKKEKTSEFADFLLVGGRRKPVNKQLVPAAVECVGDKTSEPIIIFCTTRSLPSLCFSLLFLGNLPKLLPVLIK
jgi:hypothetical protein